MIVASIPGLSKPGCLFAFYKVGNFTGRAWIEERRIDFTHVIGSLRLSQRLSIRAVLAAVGHLISRRNARENGVHTRAGSFALAREAIQ